MERMAEPGGGDTSGGKERARPMHYSDKYVTRAEFLEALVPVVDLESVAWMRSQRHHLCVTVLDHSLFVAYMSFLMARHWKRCDPVQAAQAGFLHDLYLYDPKQRGSHEGTQCFAHPEHALANAVRLFPWLSEREQNAIVAHMFPLAKHLPRYRESWAVTFSDKICAVLEATYLSRTVWIRRRRPTVLELDGHLAFA